MSVFQLEALEFLHDSGYSHADIKASNLVVGLGREHSHQIYLVDYGLAGMFLLEGGHRKYKPDSRALHDGTLEFTSIDAHNGACKSHDWAGLWMLLLSYIKEVGGGDSRSGPPKRPIFKSNFNSTLLFPPPLLLAPVQVILEPYCCLFCGLSNDMLNVYRHIFLDDTCTNIKVT